MTAENRHPGINNKISNFHLILNHKGNIVDIIILYGMDLQSLLRMICVCFLMHVVNNKYYLGVHVSKSHHSNRIFSQ